MSAALIDRRGPCPVAVRPGEDYLWCPCGCSTSQPFCGGSHKGAGLVPFRFHAERDEPLYFCGYKRIHTPPCCDGTHESL